MCGHTHTQLCGGPGRLPWIACFDHSTWATWLLQVMMATTPGHIPVLSSLIPVYLPLLLFDTSLLTSFSYQFIPFESFFPPTHSIYSQDVKRSATVAVFRLYGRAQDSRLYCVEYSKPNPSHNAAVRHREHTRFPCSLRGMFLKLT